MVAVPAVVRCKHQGTEYNAHPPVGSLRFKEGAMAAIMKDNEYPHQKSRSRNRQQKCKPVRYLKAVVHQDPHQNIWHHRIDHLPPAHPRIREIVSFYYLNPGDIIVLSITARCIQGAMLIKIRNVVRSDRLRFNVTKLLTFSEVKNSGK